MSKSIETEVHKALSGVKKLTLRVNVLTKGGGHLTNNAHYLSICYWVLLGIAFSSDKANFISLRDRSEATSSGRGFFNHPLRGHSFLFLISPEPSAY